MNRARTPLPQLVSGYHAASIPVSSIEIRLLRLPVQETLTASHGWHRHRELTVVRLRGANDAAPSDGWGECAALPTAAYWPETAESSFESLSGVAERLHGRAPVEFLDLNGETDTPLADGLATTSEISGCPMARAALEMAVLDLVLTAADTSLAELLDVGTDPIPAGATIGMATPAVTAERADALYRQGFTRIKLKIEPDHDVSVLEAVFERVGGAVGRGTLVVQVDANGSYDSSADAKQVLLRLAELGVEVIEQPFPVDQIEPPKALRGALAAAGLPTLVLTDEGAVTAADAVDLVAAEAADGFVIKPSRLGGFTPALDLLGRANRGKFAVAVGGMQESGLGRHALAVLAAVAHQSPSVLVGDLSPARRWLAADPWPDIEMVDDDGPARVVVPRGPGVAPPPDHGLLDRYTVRTHSVP